MLMTHVSLDIFRIATPIKVEVFNKADQMKPHIELPQEFFGLGEKEQVSVLSAVHDASLLHIRKIREADIEQEDRIIFTKQTLHVPIGLTISKRIKLTVDVDMSFPEIWESMSCSQKIRILESMVYLINASCISIVNRFERKSKQ